MRLTVADVTFLRDLNERCRRGTETERRSAGKARRAWIKDKLEQGVPLDELEILCDVDRDEILAWCAPEAPIYPSAQVYVDPVLLRRHLPGEPQPSRRSVNFIAKFETKKCLSPDNRAALAFMDIELARDSEVVPQRSRRGTPITILIMTGSDSNGNNFNAGVTRIRELFRIAKREAEACPNITADEVSPHRRSSILRLAFHSTGSAVELADSCDPSKPVQVEISNLAAMLATKPAPGLLVLAGCNSTSIAAHLGSWSSAIVFWPGEVSDRSLYKSLLQGRSWQILIELD